MVNNLQSSHGQIICFTDMPICFSGPACLELQTRNINPDVPELSRTERVCNSTTLSSPPTQFLSLLFYMYFPSQLMTQASTQVSSK